MSDENKLNFVGLSSGSITIQDAVDATISISNDVIITDSVYPECEWIIVVEAGEIKLKPNNKEATRRHNLKEILDDD